jgi:hypothetical protein
MRQTQFFLVAIGVVALMLLGAKLVLAQPLPPQYYGPGGGAITGYILGFDMFDQLQPIAWASVYADNGQNKFIAYSSSSGYYEMFVPTGTYNVTVVEPGYKFYSNTIAVSNGSTSTINFYLEQSHVPVPEFPSGMIQAVAIVTLSAALLAMRRIRRKKQ